MENKGYIVEIKSISSDGNGVGHIDGRVVFVPYTAAGDTVKIRIDAVKPKFALGSVIEIITPSSDRIVPDCPFYKTCGGCSLRHIKYSAELGAKRETVENAMRRIGGFKDFELSSITGMENPDRYRNKTIFHSKDGKFGFFTQKSHELTVVDDCLLGIEENRAIIAAVEAYCKTSKDTAKQLFIRKAFATGEIMAVLTSNGIKNPDLLKDFLKPLNIDSLILNMGKRYETLLGKDTIEDVLCGIKFEISPSSFFQVNPIQVQRLYDKALELAKITPQDIVMDIYCGIGTISLCAAKHAKKVVGIEVVKQAISDAKKNAAKNGITNAEFYAGKAEEIVPQLVEKGEKPSIVILDPPRAGSDKKTLDAIATAAPDRIVYVSCNSATLARDTAYLAKYGYEISAAEAFDMFPRTNHVETVVAMRRK